MTGSLHNGVPSLSLQMEKRMAGKLDQIIVIDVESTCWEDRPPENDASEIIEVGICVVNVYYRWACPGVAADGSHETGRAAPDPRAASGGLGRAVSHHALHHSQAQSARRIMGQ